MKVKIEFDMDIYHSDNDSLIHDLIGDWTYEMRSTRRLNNWKIDYRVPETVEKR